MPTFETEDPSRSTPPQRYYTFYILSVCILLYPDRYGATQKNLQLAQRKMCELYPLKWHGITHRKDIGYPCFHFSGKLTHITFHGYNPRKFSVGVNPCIPYVGYPRFPSRNVGSPCIFRRDFFRSRGGSSWNVHWRLPWEFPPTELSRPI